MFQALRVPDFRLLWGGGLISSLGSWLLLFTSSSLAAALPAATAVGLSGSMALVVQQTTVQRLIPGAVLGRVSAVFLAGEAAATLAGSVAGPFVAQATGLTAAATVASLVTLGAAALTLRSPRDEAGDDGLRPDIGHVRLGEQLQGAELGVVTPGEQVREVVDSVLPVADGGRDEAHPPDRPACRRQSEREVEQRPGRRPARAGFQNAGKREDPPSF